MGTKTWKFELGDAVELTSGEKGSVIGRGEYQEASDTFLIRYTAGDGRLTENWWQASAIKG